MTTYIPFNELQQNDLIRYTVGGDVVKVNSVESGLVCLATGEQLPLSYVELIGRLPQVKFQVNKKSGVAHAVLNGKALCGARHTNSSVSVNSCTCEKCNKIMED